MKNLVDFELEVLSEADKRSIDVIIGLADRLDSIRVENPSEKELLDIYVNLKKALHHLNKGYRFGFLSANTCDSSFDAYSDRIKILKEKIQIARERYYAAKSIHT